MSTWFRHAVTAAVTSAAMASTPGQSSNVQLVPATARAGEQVGWSVDMVGDLVIAGAPWHESLCTGPVSCYSGAAFSFQRDSTGAWTELDPMLAGDKEDRGSLRRVCRSVRQPSRHVRGRLRSLGGNGRGGRGHRVRAGGGVFGFSHDVALEGSLVLVGAPTAPFVPRPTPADSGRTGAGYLFVQQPVTTSNQGWAGYSTTFGVARWLGWSVALSGRRAALGAPHEASSRGVGVRTGWPPDERPRGDVPAVTD